MSLFDQAKAKLAQAAADENTTDQVIEKVGDFIDQRTGGAHADRIDQAQRAADERLGTE